MAARSLRMIWRDAPVIKPPLGAVPYPDEWLSAIEAAGELERLEKKFYRCQQCFNFNSCGQTNHCCVAPPWVHINEPVQLASVQCPVCASGQVMGQA